MRRFFSNSISTSFGFLKRTNRYWIVLLTLYALLVIGFDVFRPIVTTANPDSYWPRRWYPIATLDFQTDNDGQVIDVEPKAQNEPPFFPHSCDRRHRPLTLAIVFTEEVLKGVVVKIMPVDWFAVFFSAAVTVVFHDWLHHQIEHLIFPGWYREREKLEETASQPALFHIRDGGAPFIRHCVFQLA